MIDAVTLRSRLRKAAAARVGRLAAFARAAGGAKTAKKKIKGATGVKASGPCGANKAGGGGFLKGNTCWRGGRAEKTAAAAAKASTTTIAAKSASVKALEKDLAAKAKAANREAKAKAAAAKKEAAAKMKAEKAAAAKAAREAKAKAAAAKKEAAAKMKAEKAAAAKAAKSTKAKATATKAKAVDPKAQAREAARQQAKESVARLKAEKAAAKAKGPAGGRTTSVEDVRKAMTDPKTGKLYGTIDQRYDAAAAFIAANQSKQRASVQAHGMSNPEEMYSIRVGGQEYRYASNDRVTDSGMVLSGRGAMSTTLIDLATDPRGPLPKSLTMHTKAIIFTGQRNKYDSHWEQKYNTSGFQSAATGGDGRVTVYNGEPITRGLLAHEMGHNLATAKYGRAEPGGDYRAAMSGPEPPVSDYARNSPAEDFAEAMREYASGPTTMKMTHPRRYAVIDRLMKEPDYGG
jgi:hypothetical protein